MNQPVKYRKSKIQRDKEKRRRDKIFEMMISHDWIKESEMAARLGVSRSTIQRDKRKLKRRVKRYFADLERQREMERQEESARRLKELDELSGKELVARYIAFANLMMGKRPFKGKPRGKPFTSEYQPRLGRWGFWPFRCQQCGFEGKVEITGFWRRGEKALFNCPRCGELLEVVRPDLPIEQRSFTTPCGYAVVVTIKGRWERNHDLLFDCPKCGKAHRIEKRFTSRA